MEVILASRSPRRRTLLQAAGLAVEVRPVHVDETLHPGETAREAVQRLARAKAEAFDTEAFDAMQATSETPVIAADTLVSVDDEPLGQPRSLDEARVMLNRLSGRTHQVFTGVCVRRGSRFAEGIACTDVRFVEITDAMLDAWLAHNEVMDKAGAYEIQGGGASFVRGVDGPLDNVIGLPVRLVFRLLEEAAGT